MPSTTRLQPTHEEIDDLRHLLTQCLHSMYEVSTEIKRVLDAITMLSKEYGHYSNQREYLQIRYNKPLARSLQNMGLTEGRIRHIITTLGRMQTLAPIRHISLDTIWVSHGEIPHSIDNIMDFFEHSAQISKILANQIMQTRDIMTLPNGTEDILRKKLHCMQNTSPKALDLMERIELPRIYSYMPRRRRNRIRLN